MSYGVQHLKGYNTTITTKNILIINKINKINIKESKIKLFCLEIKNICSSV